MFGGLGGGGNSPGKKDNPLINAIINKINNTEEMKDLKEKLKA